MCEQIVDIKDKKRLPRGDEKKELVDLKVLMQYSTEIDDVFEERVISKLFRQEEEEKVVEEKYPTV